MTSDAQVPTLRFSASEWPEPERMEAIREHYGRTIMQSDIDPLHEAAVDVEARMRAFPGLGFAQLNCSHLRFRRTAQSLFDDTVVFTVSLSGSRTVSQRGRDVAVGAGEAILTTGAEPISATTVSSSQFIAMRVPFNALAPLVPNLNDRVALPIGHDVAALRLLTSYAGLLEDEQTLTTPELRRLSVTHLYDIMGLALGASRDAAEAAKGRGLAAARLKAIKDDIAKNLDNEDLSVGAIAMRHQVTPRYIQMLFENDGVTFTEYVIGQRLALAHRKLADPRNAGEKISSIAFDCGFGDLSYFHRLFRRHFGLSPADVRAATHRAN
jgi:AraC-like DNA-binding protein